MKRAVVLLLILGVGFGVAGTLLLPRFARRVLPESIVEATRKVSGAVVAEERQADRLLLTIETPEGAVLATFRKRVAEIDLLVAPGDTVILGLARYAPFVEDPQILKVQKPGASAETPHQ